MMRAPNGRGPIGAVVALFVGAFVALGAAGLARAENPCAANPCAANPCAANPCAANPCAMNPCAANPCAAQPCAMQPCAAAPAPELGDEEAAAAYEKIAGTLAAGYAKSGHPVVGTYRNWTKFNRVPYLSETHGNRYVNNYANEIAGKEYARFEKAGPMPAGSTLVKDTFRAKPGGGTEPGPLNIMEKMEAEFNPESGDWRFTMIMPDGTVYGATRGPNGARVNFCAECHGAAPTDFLFFMPEEYRASF